MDAPPHRPELIEKTPEYLEAITSLAHPEGLLSRKGYLTEQLTSSELARKKRCLHCAKVLHKTVKIRWIWEMRNGLETYSDQVPKDLCKYHTGAVRAKHWTCCGSFVAAPGCTKAAKHTPRDYADNELENDWQLHPTPSPSPTTQGRHRGGRVTAIKPADAVTIDCEMGTSEHGDSELIRLTVIDYFTGEVLLDKLVWPDCRMQHFNTRFSGITRQMMNDARRKRTCLFGRATARAEMWKFIGPDTVVVGHGSNNDFTSLRWIHPRIVDTYLIEESHARLDKAKYEAAYAEYEEERDALIDREEPWEHLERPHAPVQGSSLRALADTRLQRPIQRGRGHDSLEDALACRDILHWHVVNRLDRPSKPDPCPLELALDELAIAE